MNNLPCGRPQHPIWDQFIRINEDSKIRHNKNHQIYSNKVHAI